MIRNPSRVDLPPGAGLTNLLELIAFKTLADLRGISYRTYLGFLWWVIEPLLMMGVFVLLVDVLQLRGKQGLVPFLLTGIVLWQWYNKSILNSANSVLQAQGLLRNVRVSSWIFPVVSVLADTFRFMVVLLLLLVLLAIYRQSLGETLLVLPLILFLLLPLIGGISLLIALAVPFFPDVRFAVTPIIRLQFFVSGIFFEVDRLPEQYQYWLQFNPMLVFIEAARSVVLSNDVPNMLPLLAWAALGLLLFSAGVAASRILTPLYAKLPA